MPSDGSSTWRMTCSFLPFVTFCVVFCSSLCWMVVLLSAFPSSDVFSLWVSSSFCDQLLGALKFWHSPLLIINNHIDSSLGRVVIHAVCILKMRVVFMELLLAPSPLPSHCREHTGDWPLRIAIKGNFAQESQCGGVAGGRVLGLLQRCVESAAWVFNLLPVGLGPPMAPGQTRW